MEVQRLTAATGGPVSPVLSSSPQIMPRASSLERSTLAFSKSVEALGDPSKDKSGVPKRTPKQREESAWPVLPSQVKGKGKIPHNAPFPDTDQVKAGTGLVGYADSPCSSLISTFEPMQIDTSSHENHVHFAPGRVSLLPSLQVQGQSNGSKLKNELQLDDPSHDATHVSSESADVKTRPRSVSAIAAVSTATLAQEQLRQEMSLALAAEGPNDRSFLPDVDNVRPASRSRAAGLLKMRAKPDEAQATTSKPARESTAPPSSAALALQYSDQNSADVPREVPARHRSSGALRSLFRRRGRADEDATPMPALQKLPGESEWEASLRASDEQARKATEKAKRAHALAAEFSLEKPTKRSSGSKPRVRSRHSISSGESAVSASDINDGQVYRIDREHGFEVQNMSSSALPSYRSRTSTAEHMSPLQRTPSSASHSPWAARHHGGRPHVADTSFFSPASSSASSFRSRSDSSAGCGPTDRGPSDTSALSSHHHGSDFAARVRFEDSPTLGSDGPHQKAQATPSPRGKRPSTAGSPYAPTLSSATKLARILGSDADWSSSTGQSFPSKRLQDPAIYTGSMSARHPYAVAAQDLPKRPNTSHASSSSQSSEDWKNVIDQAYVANETLLRRLPASSDDLRVTSTGNVLSRTSSLHGVTTCLGSSEHERMAKDDDPSSIGLANRRHAPRPRMLELPPSPAPSSGHSDPSRSSTPRHLSDTNMLGLRSPSQACATPVSSASNTPTSHTLSLSGDSQMSCGTSSLDAGETGHVSSGPSSRVSSQDRGQSTTASRASSVFRSSAYPSPVASPTICIKDLSEPCSVSHSMRGAVALSPRRMSRCLPDGSASEEERCLSPRRIPIATPPPTAPLPLPPTDSPKSFVTTLSRTSSAASHSSTRLSPMSEAHGLEEDHLKTPTM